MYCAVPGLEPGVLLFIHCMLQREMFLASLCAVDIGEENPRNVCSGLTKHVPLEEMQVCRWEGWGCEGMMSEGGEEVRGDT